jgi:hypothetical protein
VTYGRTQEEKDWLNVILNHIILGKEPVKIAISQQSHKETKMAIFKTLAAVLALSGVSAFTPASTLKVSSQRYETSKQYHHCPAMSLKCLFSQRNGPS